MIQSLETNFWIRKKILFLLCLMLIPLIVLEIWVSNNLSGYGGKIQALKEAQNSLKFQNELLENEIAQKSSLLQIEATAKNLGFEKLHNIQYLQLDNLALKH